MNLGAPELLIVLLVILVLFGGAKLPKLARSLGQAKKEFESGIRDDGSGAAPVVDVPVVPAPAPEKAPDPPTA